MSVSTLSLSSSPRSMARVTAVAPSEAAAMHSSVRRISSQRLLDGERELVIQHLDSEYHLRLTRNGKLILTK